MGNLIKRLQEAFSIIFRQTQKRAKIGLSLMLSTLTLSTSLHASEVDRFLQVDTEFTTSGTSKNNSHCKFQRGLIGVELLGIINRDANWQVGNTAFENNVATNFFTSTVFGCELNEQIKFTAQPSLQLVTNTQKPGELEGELHEYLLLLNEAKLSTQINQEKALTAIYVDAGKLRLHTGYLFGYSPLHLLRTISGDLKSVPVSGYSNDAKDFYNEGIYGVNSSIYGDHGTYQFAVFPKLTQHLDLNQPVTELSHFSRTNGMERYYASFTSNGISNYHTTVTMLLGTQQKAAFGMSKIFNDKWIISAESALLNGQTWQHFSAEHAGAIQQFQFIEQPFGTHSNQFENEFAIGLRYTTEANSEVGAEFFYQSQGYSKHTWRALFDTLHFINGDYQSKLPIEIPSLRQAYQAYSRLFASQLDNVRRNGYLLDKSYLTLYAQNNQEGFNAINWAFSSQINLRDQSTAIDGQISMLLNDNVTAFTGIKSAIGKRESEFGLFGDRINVYSGIQFNW